TGLGCCREFGPGIRPVTMQVQGSALDHDPAVAHSIVFFTMNIVGESDGRLARVGFGFSADLQFPEHHDPLGGELDVGFVREAEFACDMQAVQRGRTDIQEHILAFFNGDRIPALGTFPSGQVAGFDQSSCLTACDPSAATMSNAPTRKNAGTSNAKRNERYCLLMSSISRIQRCPASSRRADLRAIMLSSGPMRLHYSSSVDY